MASPTKHTDTVRARKQKKSGAKRKAKNRNEGTTKSAKELFGDE